MGESWTGKRLILSGLSIVLAGIAGENEEDDGVE